MRQLKKVVRGRNPLKTYFDYMQQQNSVCSSETHDKM